MKNLLEIARLWACAFSFPMVLASYLPAQQAPAPKKEKVEEEPVTMSKFVVDTKRDRGYGSAYALGATCVNIPLMESPLSALTISDEWRN